jgi:hypothetical protein
MPVVTEQETRVYRFIRARVAYLRALADARERLLALMVDGKDDAAESDRSRPPAKPDSRPNGARSTCGASSEEAKVRERGSE